MKVLALSSAVVCELLSGDKVEGMGPYIPLLLLLYNKLTVSEGFFYFDIGIFYSLSDCIHVCGCRQFQKFFICVSTT